jgi:hypothetical protein
MFSIADGLEGPHQKNHRVAKRSRRDALQGLRDRIVAVKVEELEVAQA